MRITITFFFCALLLTICVSSLAQCNDWETLTAYEGVTIRDSGRDCNGNLYIIGTFRTASFKIGTTTLPLVGQSSIFIVKFDKDLKLVWGKSLGGPSNDYAQRIKVDKDDNIVVGGYFSSPTITFGSIQLVNSGRSEAFLVKYSKDGVALWAQGTIGLNDGFFMNLAITKSNSIILSSAFLAGNTTFAGHLIQKFSGYDSFVISFTSNGTFNWVRSIGDASSANPDYIIGLDTDSQENVAITGFFESPHLRFDNIVIDAFTVSENYFVAKLSKDGVALWAKGAESHVDQSGYDLVIDQKDNVIVAGRFFGGTQTKFGNKTLTSSGDADAMIVKYDPLGNVLDARNIGGAKFDTATEIEISPNGSLVVAGSFYSNELTVDAFSASKPSFQADLFVVTMTTQLVAQCFKTVSGPAESMATSLRSDQASNIWLIATDNLMTGATQFDNVFTVNVGQYPSELVSIGKNKFFDNSNPSVSLGPDIKKCETATVILDAGKRCGASYLWSTGTTEQSLTTAKAGLYWVTVSLNGITGKDSVVVSNVEKLHVDLGEDKVLCKDMAVNFDITQPQTATYLWENGSTSSVRSIKASGSYSVTVTGACETISDAIVISAATAIAFELGENQNLCTTEPFTIGLENDPKLKYHWQTGSTESRISVSESGTYSLTVSNACETFTDSIILSFFDEKSAVIPNVITPNGDSVNDKFIIPDQLIGASLVVINRWGSRVYQSDYYENNWAAENLSPGTYYITVSSPCLTKDYKGLLQVVK